MDKPMLDEEAQKSSMSMVHVVRVQITKARAVKEDLYGAAKAIGREGKQGHAANKVYIESRVMI